MEIIPINGGYKFTEGDAKSAFSLISGGGHKNVYLDISFGAKYRGQLNHPKENNISMNGQWSVLAASNFNLALDALNTIASVSDFSLDNLIIATHGGINSQGQADIKINDDKVNDSRESSYILNGELAVANGDIPGATFGDPGVLNKLATFKAITDKLSDGGNLILAACNVGVGDAGRAFGNSLNKFTGNRLNIFLAEEFVYPRGYAAGLNQSQGVWFSKMYRETFLETTGTKQYNVNITLSAVTGTPPVTIKKK
jgi:hypothetical protein